MLIIIGVSLLPDPLLDRASLCMALYYAYVFMYRCICKYIRSMNQDKLEVVKQEMARVNVDILGISELRWTGMGF